MQLAALGSFPEAQCMAQPEPLRPRVLKWMREFCFVWVGFLCLIGGMAYYPFWESAQRRAAEQRSVRIDDRQHDRINRLDARLLEIEQQIAERGPRGKRIEDKTDRILKEIQLLRARLERRR